MTLSQPAPIDSGPLQLDELPDPEPAPGQLLFRAEVCGVCRTELHVSEAELPPQRPSVSPGHKAVGRVERRGPEAVRFPINDAAVLHLS